MTYESAPPREAPSESSALPLSLPLDSTAELLTRITAQLSTQLGRVSRNGTRTGPHGTSGAPAPA
ncbi:hypothetical protein GCM10010329_85520 [Streptomyces spiroverticillatus]|uniref:Uncharacterized protein n=1 Tax=Streptomyces finlayi TaxID=67296 RepID=A0A918XAC7_9ACTN|nr:hypothetical protein [Streptomyces finlayi]GHA50334.1 hypothetical protein GCM10010329_85520 [Streptomyces spiroverticillatus]GHD19726.1 hypothetical protein GCM10010334_83610 [Streptomyces finlayi]